jgi:hypothetical protein
MKRNEFSVTSKLQLGNNEPKKVDSLFAGAQDPFLPYQKQIENKRNVLRSIISTPNFLDAGLTQKILDAVEENKGDSGVAKSIISEELIHESTQSALRKKFIGTIKTKFFLLGFSFGASLQSFVISVILLFVSHSDDAGPIQELSHEYYPIFRSIFMISFFFLLYGANVFIWRRFKIDYARVMGVSYSHTYQYVLQGSSSIAHIMFSMFIIYVLTITGGFGIHEEKNQTKHIWPFLAFIIPLVLFFYPNDKFTQPFFGVDRNGFKQRIGLLWNVLAVLASPFTEVTFQRSFIADVFCSMPKVFTDLEYTICIYATGNLIDPDEEQWTPVSKPHAYDTCGAGSTAFSAARIVLSLLPYYFRLMQSLRSYRDTCNIKHLFNGFKYTLSLSVAVLATVKQGFPEADYLLKAWFCVSIVTTIYAFYWDVVMDWGLGDLRAKHVFLRSSNSLAFPPYIYYCAIVIDLIFRLGWAIYISPGNMVLQQHFILLLGCVELLRRFVWAIFRVEWEHLQIRSEEAVRSRREERQNKMLGSQSSGESQRDSVISENMKPDIESMPERGGYFDDAPEIFNSQSSIYSDFPNGDALGYPDGENNYYQLTGTEIVSVEDDLDDSIRGTTGTSQLASLPVPNRNAPLRSSLKHKN